MKSKQDSLAIVNKQLNNTDMRKGNEVKTDIKKGNEDKTDIHNIKPGTDTVKTKQTMPVDSLKKLNPVIDSLKIRQMMIQDSIKKAEEMKPEK
jgi:hypothetical protein